MVANCDNFKMRGTKRNHDQISLSEPVLKQPKINCEVQIREQRNFDYVLSQHKTVLEETGIPYDRVENFLKDMSSIWLNKESDEELESIISQELNNVYFRLYYRNNLDSYCNLLTQILSKINSVKLIILFLQNDSLFHKTALNDQQFCLKFLKTMYPVLMNHLEKNYCQELHLKICQRFKKIIFDKKLGDFEIYLEGALKLTENTAVDNFEIPKAVLKTIGKSYNSELECSYSFKVIFQSVVNSFRDFKWVYAFSIVTLEILGFNLSRDFSIQNISKYVPTDIKQSKSLSYLSELLKILKETNFDLNCSVGINFSQFIENIVNSVLHLTSIPSKTCYEILEYSIDINPLLVEKSLTNLLAYSMFADNTDCEENYNRFMLKLFKTYDKLHRLHKLISKMLHVLKSMEENKNFEEYYTFRGSEIVQIEIKRSLKTDKVLSDEVLNYFAQCTTKVPSKQYMNLLKAFIFNLNSSVESNSDINPSYIDILCKFMSWLLRIDKMDENNTTPIAMKNFSETMVELKSILNKIGQKLLEREHDQLLVRAFLSLSYNWSDRHIKFHYYNSGYLEEPEIFYDINHPNYLFSYLTNEQWILLSQRITNFGESDCKLLMLKITIKKLMAMALFSKELEESTQREAIQQITLNIENSCEYIVSEKFIHKTLINKLDLDVIMSICDNLLNLIEDKPDIVNLMGDSIMLCNALSFTLLRKMSKILSKGKASSLLKKLMSTVDKEICSINSEVDEHFLGTLKKVYEENIWIVEENGNKDVENKIQMYLHLLKRLPIIYLSPKIRTLILLGLFSLHKYFWGSESSLKNMLENFIKDLIQEIKIDWMPLVDAVSILKNFTTNFKEGREFIVVLSEKCFKNEESLRALAPGIDYLLKNSDNLEYSLLFLKGLKKVTKSKFSLEFKEFCSELKDKIMNANFEAVISTEANEMLLQSYACCLKHWTIIKEEKKLDKLIEKLDDYLNVIFKNQSGILPKGSAALFCTVLSNRQIFKTSPELPGKVWIYCKMKSVIPCEVQDFSMLFHSVFEHVSNKEFETLSSELLDTTVEAIVERDHPQLFKHIDTFTSILNSSLNTAKFDIFQKILEKLFVEFYNLKKKTNFNQEVYKGIIKFEIAVINREILMLSPSIISMILINPCILLEEGSDFHQNFDLCMNLMECLLKHRSTMIMGRICAFLKVFRCLLSALCQKCGEAEKNNSIYIGDLADCAHKLEKLVKHLVIFKKDMACIASNLIGNILQQYEAYTLFPSVKVHLNNCMYSLLSLCEQHSESNILRSASTELFKKVFNDYKKFHRFTGKV